MEHQQATNLISKALRDIAQAEAVTGEALTTDSTAIFAAIAQAKLLAVIASMLVDIKDNYIHQVHPGL